MNSMKEVIFIALISFMASTTGSIFNPLLYSRGSLWPMTTFYGSTFLKHRPAKEYRSIPKISWLKDVNHMSPIEVEKLKEAVIKHGAVKISGQTLSRKQQMVLSEKLGEVIIIPQSFRGRDFVPEYPHIVPVCNFWSNGTWKGKSYNFGQYWHKDGDYYSFEKGYMLSLLYADQYDDGIVGGETAFINCCNLRRELPRDIEEHLKDAVISVNARDITDFKNGTEEDLSMFPEVHHKVIFKHPGKDEECIFLSLPDEMHTKADIGNQSIFRLWDFMQNPKYIMQQKWVKGDIVIWDNYGVFHRAMPFVNNEKRRMLYRTQIRLEAKQKTDQ